MPRNSLIGVVKEEEEMEGKEGKDEKDEQGIMAVLSSMTNFELLGDPKFLLICASNTFGFLGFYVPFVYLPSLAESQLDISSDQVVNTKTQTSTQCHFIPVCINIGRSVMSSIQLKLNGLNLQCSS